MRVLDHAWDIDRFFESVSSADNAVLLLDYDGTLAPFRVERDQAIPYPGVRERLASLHRLQGNRLIIVSGRDLDSLLPLLGLEEPPEIWGCHGAQRLHADGSRTESALSDQETGILDQVEAWAKTSGMEGQLERKPTGVAFHWRGMLREERDLLREKAIEWWDTKENKGRLVLHGFDGGLELRSSTVEKGVAIREILKETNESSPVAYLGDDLTDEDAFAALGGRGLSVLVRPEYRETTAHVWLRPPEEMLEFLDRWVNCRS